MGRSYEKFQEKGEQSLCFQKGTFFLAHPLKGPISLINVVSFRKRTKYISFISIIIDPKVHSVVNANSLVNTHS